MTTQLETVKAEYLAEFKRSVPRLKELAKAIRAEDVKLTDDSENTKFWQITDDPKTNYELCQLATDLDGYDEIWESHPDNKTSPATNETQYSDRVESLSYWQKNFLKSAGESCKEQKGRLAKLEALLNLLHHTAVDHEYDDPMRDGLHLAKDLANEAFNFHDVKIDMPIGLVLAKRNGH